MASSSLSRQVLRPDRRKYFAENVRGRRADVLEVGDTVTATCNLRGDARDRRSPGGNTETLGDDRVRDLRAQGSAMGIDQAVAYALSHLEASIRAR